MALVTLENRAAIVRAIVRVVATAYVRVEKIATIALPIANQRAATAFANAARRARAVRAIVVAVVAIPDVGMANVEPIAAKIPARARMIAASVVVAMGCVPRGKIAPIAPWIANLFAATGSANAAKMVLVRWIVTSSLVAMAFAALENQLVIVDKIVPDLAASILAAMGIATRAAANPTATAAIAAEHVAKDSAAMACAMARVAKACAIAMAIVPERAAWVIAMTAIAIALVAKIAATAHSIADAPMASVAMACATSANTTVAAADKIADSVPNWART